MVAVKPQEKMTLRPMVRPQFRLVSTYPSIHHHLVPSIAQYHPAPTQSHIIKWYDQTRHRLVPPVIYMYLIKPESSVLPMYHLHPHSYRY